MATQTLYTKILLLNGSQGTWAQLKDYVLSKGEPAVEFIPETGSTLEAVKVKIGDGITTFENLPYVGQEIAENLASLVLRVNGLEEEIDANTSAIATLQQTVSTLGNAVFEIEATSLADIEGDTEGAKIANYLAAQENAPVVKEGNIAIVKRQIVAADAEKEIEARYEYTAYAYNGTAWAAMDGNYNAENVYFNDDITFTANIGALSLESGKTKGTYASKGKSLEEVLKGIMAKTIAPTIKQPSYSLDSVTANVGTSVEIGTKVTKLTWAATFTDGSYSYKSTQAPTSTAAGCTATYSMSCTLPGKNAGEGYTTSDAAKQDGSLTLNEAFQVTSTTEATVGTINTTCKISDSPRTPLNNIGDEVSGKITNVADKTGSKSFKVTGYRAWFCGYKNGDNAIKAANGAADATLITGDQIRALGNSANGSWLSSMNVSQMQQMFFAAPAGKGYKPSVADSKTTAPQTVQGPITVYVKGANDYVAAGDETTNGGIAYDVWYVNNTSAASGSAGLTIGKA
jgi:hypothetical protein